MSGARMIDLPVKCGENTPSSEFSSALLQKTHLPPQGGRLHKCIHAYGENIPLSTVWSVGDEPALFCLHLAKKGGRVGEAIMCVR